MLWKGVFTHFWFPPTLPVCCLQLFIRLSINHTLPVKNFPAQYKTTTFFTSLYKPDAKIQTCNHKQVCLLSECDYNTTIIYNKSVTLPFSSIIRGITFRKCRIYIWHLVPESFDCLHQLCLVFWLHLPSDELFQFMPSNCCMLKIFNWIVIRRFWWRPQPIAPLESKKAKTNREVCLGSLSCM